MRIAPWTSILVVLVAAASATSVSAQHYSGSVYSAGPNGPEGMPTGAEATGGFYGDQLLPFDSPHQWMHGYYREMPAYGGYSAFRPYNYKHVLSQSQVAGGWGMSPRMPYSQQYWNRFRHQTASFGGRGYYAMPQQAPLGGLQPSMEAMRPQAPGSMGMPPVPLTINPARNPYTGNVARPAVTLGGPIPQHGSQPAGRRQ